VAERIARGWWVGEEWCHRDPKVSAAPRGRCSTERKDRGFRERTSIEVRERGMTRIAQQNVEVVRFSGTRATGSRGQIVKGRWKRRRRRTLKQSFGEPNKVWGHLQRSHRGRVSNMHDGGQRSEGASLAVKTIASERKLSDRSEVYGCRENTESLNVSVRENDRVRGWTRQNRTDVKIGARCWLRQRCRQALAKTVC
jgi:hypothetical protein